MRLQDIFEVKVHDFPSKRRDLRIWQDASPAQMAELARKYDELRGLVDDRHSFVWRSSLEIHHFAATALGGRPEDFDHILIVPGQSTTAAGEWQDRPYRDVVGMRIYFEEQRFRHGFLERNRQFSRLLFPPAPAPDSAESRLHQSPNAA